MSFGRWWKDILSGASAGAVRDLVRATEGGVVEGLSVVGEGLSAVQSIVSATAGAATTVIDAFDPEDDEADDRARRRAQYERRERERCECDCTYRPRILEPERAEKPAPPKRRRKKKATRRKKKATRKTTRRKKPTRRKTR